MTTVSVNASDNPLRRPSGSRSTDESVRSALSAIQTYTTTSSGEASLLRVSDTHVISFDWKPVSKKARHISIEFGRENSHLTVRANAHVLVPAHARANCAVLMNVLNLNSDLGSFRLNIDSGVVSYVISSYLHGCALTALVARLLHNIDEKLDTFVDLCVLASAAPFNLDSK